MNNTIFLDFSKTDGEIKPMNAVNNGPTKGNVRNPRRQSWHLFEQARFPYSRNHDASFYVPFSGEHIVDVHRIFRDFDADEADPSSYLFEPTDEYLKNTIDVGCKVFYRLGATIEHYYKFGTRAPKDFAKWARICEHIIMHYTKGWANGFYYDIEYWEIWNEPDCQNPDGTNPCWQGTEDEFIALYEVTAKHLKKCFPDIKIGGPAFCTPWPTEFKRRFLETVKKKEIPFDFYSFHWYGKHIVDLVDTIKVAQEELERAGLSGTMTILNEWNYVRGWLDDIWDYSIMVERNLKGSSFVGAAMCVSQENCLDMLMYYDATPCEMNGLFNMNSFKPYKPYYLFVYFSRLSDMGEYVRVCDLPEDIYICAAKGIEKSGFMITYYNDNDDGFHKELSVPCHKKELVFNIINPYHDRKLKIKYYLTDEQYDDKLINECFVNENMFCLKLDISLFSSYYIEFIPE